MIFLQSGILHRIVKMLCNQTAKQALVYEGPFHCKALELRTWYSYSECRAGRRGWGRYI